LDPLSAPAGRRGGATQLSCRRLVGGSGCTPDVLGELLHLEPVELLERQGSEDLEPAVEGERDVVEEPLLHFRRSDECRRVIDPPVSEDGLSGPDRARLARVVTDGDHEIERQVAEVVPGLAPRVRGVNVKTLAEHLQSHRVDHASWIRPRAVRLESLTAESPQEVFRKDAAGGVTGTEEEDSEGRVDGAHEATSWVVGSRVRVLAAGRLRSHRQKAIAAPAPMSCPNRNPGTSAGRIPEKVSVAARARVTAGLAKAVEDVNQ